MTILLASFFFLQLRSLGLDHLIGTPALKPYMHGYFLSLQLYDTARVIANPYIYEEHRERMVKDKLDKMAETRIRARKDVGVKVNKALAEKIHREEEREKKRAARKAARVSGKEGGEGDDEMDVDNGEENEAKETEKPNLLNDPRFQALFENPEFAVDEASREFALLNPSSVARRQNTATTSGSKGKHKTAVEEEEEESDKVSSDGLSESESESGDGDDGDSDDSDRAGGNPSIQLLSFAVIDGVCCNRTLAR